MKRGSGRVGAASPCLPIPLSRATSINQSMNNNTGGSSSSSSNGIFAHHNSNNLIRHPSPSMVIDGRDVHFNSINIDNNQKQQQQHQQHQPDHGDANGFYAPPPTTVSLQAAIQAAVIAASISGALLPSSSSSLPSSLPSSPIASQHKVSSPSSSHQHHPYNYEEVRRNNASTTALRQSLVMCC